MARGGSRGRADFGDAHIDGSGQFLHEEDKRGKLSGGGRVMPRPHFVQVDNGTHTEEAGGFDVDYDITKRPMKYGNVEKDLNGGLF